MSWFRKILTNKHANKDSKKKEFLLKKIESSINKCQSEIKKSEKEIKQIKNWMAELIHETFFVPGNFWYEEFKNYQQIKKHEENLNIPIKKIEEVEKLLNDYQTQIHFREKKIELKSLMIEKFQKAKQQLNNLKAAAKGSPLSSNFQTFEKHQNRLQKLNETQNELIDEQKQDELLQQLMFQINELIENKKIDEEVKTFMKKLNSQLSADILEENPEKIINEMQSLIDEYKSRTI